MKRYLKNNDRTIKFLNKLPKLYTIVYNGVCEIREDFYVGKKDRRGIPLVYHLDVNINKYELIPIDYTFNYVVHWVDDKNIAEDFCMLYNKIDRYREFFFSLDKREGKSVKIKELTHMFALIEGI